MKTTEEAIRIEAFTKISAAQKANKEAQLTDEEKKALEKWRQSVGNMPTPRDKMCVCGYPLENHLIKNIIITCPDRDWETVLLY
jgi:hypothetical protein